MSQSFKALLIYLFFTALFFAPVFLRGELIDPRGLAFKIDPIYQSIDIKGNINPLLSDLTFEFYPWRSFVNQWIKQGAIPFWNPTIYGGMPFVANDQSAIFYPLNVLSYFLPLSWQFTFLFYIKIFLACFFTFLFARLLKFSFVASILSGLIFGWSGFVTVWLGYGITNVVVFLPLVLWAIKKNKENGFKSVYSLILIFAWVSQLLGGHLETFALLIPFYAVFILHEFGFFQTDVALIDSSKPPRFSFVLGMLALFILSIGLTAIQWLPFLEYIGKTAIFSGRLNQGFALIDFSFLKNLPSLVTFLAPNFFGNPVDKTFWNPFQNYNEGIFYIGVLPLVFALVAFWRGYRFKIRFWLVTGLLTLLASLLILPFNILASLPFFSILDFHRFRLFLVFSLAVLAGFGLDKILKEEIRGDWLRKIGTISLISGVGYLGFLTAVYYFLVFQKVSAINVLQVMLSRFGQGLSFGLGQGIGDTAAKVQVLYDRLLASFSPFSFQNILPFLLLVSCFPIFFFKDRLDLKKWFGLILVLVFVDLTFVGFYYQPTINRNLSKEEPAIISEIKKDQSFFRIAALGQTLVPNSASNFGLQDVRGADIVSSDYHKFFHSFNGAWQTNLYFFLNEADHKFLDLMNVKYLIVEKNFSFNETNFEKKGDFGAVELWENKTVWPRAFVTPSSFGHIVGIEFDKAKILKYKSDEVLIKTKVDDERGLLVLADSYDSGWQVFVDGQKADLLEAYDVLRAVKLERGDHLVKFIYQPWSVVWGTRIFVISLGIIVLLGVMIFLREVGFLKFLKVLKGDPLRSKGSP